MARMFHRSSGRNNFDVVEPNTKTDPAPSRQQTSNDQANLIEQQTRDAIKIAAENNQTNNKNHPDTNIDTSNKVNEGQRPGIIQQIIDAIKKVK